MAAKLEELSWPAVVAIRAYGLKIGFRASQPIGLAGIERTFPYAWRPSRFRDLDRVYSIVVSPSKPSARRPRYHRLYVDGEELNRSHSLDYLLDAIASDLHLYIGEWAHDRVFVHAGVVGYRGRAIVIPGQSMAGKSTLVAEFLRQGARYYSDDFAVLDGKCRVHPYAAPLGLRRPGEVIQEHRTVDELGARRGTRPLPVGLVIVTQYVPGSRWEPERLSPGRGLLELVPHTLSAIRAPEPAFAALEGMVARAPVLKGPRGEAPEAVAGMMAYL